MLYYAIVKKNNCDHGERSRPEKMLFFNLIQFLLLCIVVSEEKGYVVCMGKKNEYGNLKGQHQNE